MIRQTGLALGVAVLGTHEAGADSFDHGWWLTAGLSALTVVPALALLRRSGLLSA